MRVRVKSCGNRSEADVRASVLGGADAVGFICGTTHFSEDALEPTAARLLAASVPPFVTTVLVTHLTDGSEIANLLAEVGTDRVQVQGRMAPAAVQALAEIVGRRRIIKTVHVTGTASLEVAARYAPIAGAVLLDSGTADRLGGTGQTHDWSVSRTIVDTLAGHVVLLAGGLSGTNVTEAIRTVRPFGVDANSGLDDADGNKDLDRVRAFAAGASL